MRVVCWLGDVYIDIVGEFGDLLCIVIRTCEVPS